MSDLFFLKLGGSLLTDKRGEQALRSKVLARLAQEIRRGLDARPELSLVIGHGSGSFGHVAAAPYRTRSGVQSAHEWRGFAEVSAAAARLNRFVCDALQQAGVPAITFQPSASARCHHGELTSLAVQPVRAALAAGLVPLLYGDVAFDTGQGGTIVSTEEILSYLAGEIVPRWLLLAGDTAGVYDSQGEVLPAISEANFAEIEAALGGSGGTDVTGGMAGKVKAMLALAARHPGLRTRVFSGLEAGRLEAALREPGSGRGTLITG